MKKKLPVLLVLASIFICSLRAQTPKNDPRITRVEQGLLPNAEIIFADSANKHFTIADRMRYYHIPSISIAVISNGKIAWAKAYGLADADGNRKADVHTLYQAASISKSINAFCITRLACQGRLNLNKDIRTYLKTWTFPDNELSKGKIITIKNLLSHTAGLGTGGFRGYAKGDSVPSINEILDGKRPANSEAVKPVLPPGTKVQYSGGGTLVSKKILTDNINSDYANLVKNTVLKPLGMRESTFEQPLPAGRSNFAIAYDKNKKALAGKYYIYPEQAPDGLWTNPTDYAKFILALQHSLKANGGFLSKMLANEMITPVLAGSDAALGTFIIEKGGEKYFTHTGANMGYRSIYYGSCSTGNGVVIMANSDNAQILDELVNSVAVAYSWKDFYKPEVRRLVTLPDTLAKQYAGQYHSEQPALTIRIIRKGNDLQLSTHGDGNFETMYFMSDTTFFLMSSPTTTATILKTRSGNDYNLVVKQGDKVLITAKKF
ncbi:MAG: serine hydrolase domain-containing protein [Mucilaginibacter sp.]